MAHNTKRSAARQAVEKLERPEGISAPTWRGVVALLRAIAEFYPNPYPSQKVLAARTGYSIASIERYVACAKAEGLLLVKADAGKCSSKKAWKKTNRYLIVNPSNCGDTMPSECGVKPTALRASGRELRSSHSPSESSLSAAKISRQDPEGPSRQVTGKALPKPLAKTPPRRKTAGDITRETDSGRRLRSSVPSNAPRPPRATPWRECASYFLSGWDELVTSTAQGDPLRSVRPAETMGHFQSYMQAHWFGPNAMTPKSVDEVKVLIAAFLVETARGKVKIKGGQSAWMAFTGAWGRRPDVVIPVEVEDEYVPPQYRNK